MRSAAVSRPLSPVPRAPAVIEPVLGDAGSRKGAALASPIELQAGQGDLDHQRGAGGMRVAVVARRATDHADVRLRLRPGIERDRSLSAHVPPRPESHPQGVLDEADGGHMGTALGLLHQHEAVEQLEPLVGAEEAALDELFVLPPTPAPHANRAGVHDQGQSRTLPSPASTSTGGYDTGSGRRGVLTRAGTRGPSPAAPAG